MDVSGGILARRKEPEPLEGILKCYGYTPTRLAKLLKCCPNTAKTKMTVTDRLTARDIKLLIRNGVDPQKIMEALIG